MRQKCILTNLSFVIIFFIGPGEMKVSLDFSPNRHFLDIHVGEIKDVKLPAGKICLSVCNEIPLTNDWLFAVKGNAKLH